MSLPSCHRINHQPDMIMGLNGTETLCVILVSFALGMSISVVITTVINLPAFVALVGFALTLAIAFVAARALRFVKRQRPQGYYQQWIRVRGAQWFGSRVLITHGGAFDHLRHELHDFRRGGL